MVREIDKLRVRATTKRLLLQMENADNEEEENDGEQEEEPEPEQEEEPEPEQEQIVEDEQEESDEPLYDDPNYPNAPSLAITYLLIRLFISCNRLSQEAVKIFLMILNALLPPTAKRLVYSGLAAFKNVEDIYKVKSDCYCIRCHRSLNNERAPCRNKSCIAFDIPPGCSSENRCEMFIDLDWKKQLKEVISRNFEEIQKFSAECARSPDDCRTEFLHGKNIVTHNVNMLTKSMIH